MRKHEVKLSRQEIHHKEMPNMPISNFIALALIILQSLVNNHNSFSQIQIVGKVIDARNLDPLAYVNIGIKEKNIGTITTEEGSFKITIPAEYQFDSLTISCVGYYDESLHIPALSSEKIVIIKMKEKTTQLQEVIVNGKKLVEKKYGIKRRSPIRFTDGIFKKDDSFEIGQVIHLGNSPAEITSLNLHINSSRPDSGSFRINFYRFDIDDNTPKERIVEKSILQRHPISEGWLKFDLSNYDIVIEGNVLVSLEFIPETEKDVKQILYEVKIGGSSKSFFRKNSLGQWTRPPHHYCLYVTAITDKDAPEEGYDEETLPAITLKSDFSNEPFSLFVRLPRNYSKNGTRTYPVIYLLDGNAYFDAVANSADSFFKKKKDFDDPIIVGIGYENAYIMDSLRNRDYTFPKALPADSFKISGKGDRFYEFIKSKVIPTIDSTYRTDKGNRTIAGHSLGGYFVLYSMMRQLKEPVVFRNFVAASASIYYHDKYLIKEIESNHTYHKNIENVKLYLTIGELELSENRSVDFRKLSEILVDKKINVRTEVYKNLEHMGTAIPTFENGIKRVMVKR